ncbi:MAG: sigma-70 family RNA polymerase sigma factor [Fimbriimonadales bacterium]
MATVGAIGLSRATEEKVLDGAIISRCQRRDSEAFGLLVDRYQARIFGYVRRMVYSAEDAEDIAQEVFVKAFQNIDRFDGRASLTTWLFKIANNLCIDKKRRKDRRPQEAFLSSEEADQAFEVADSRWDPESHAVAQEMAVLVESSLRQMSDKLRTVILLHDKEELSYEQIAEIVNVPVGTVKSRLFLAREQLQIALRGYQNSGGLK